ncbi:hypothetical protein C8T65DRAFT_734101 [Cerioporus squamosus]|nr:hypothetical protein C8T65DRAFT_734101 [Cerioporus squamosus]
MSSDGSPSAAARDTNSKPRRRWTYTGPTRSHGYSSTPSPRHSGAGESAVNEVKSSPLTEHTVSTALSSPLNTPDLADWPTQLGGSESLLLNNFVSSSSSQHPVARYSKASPVRQGAGPSTYRPRFLSGASRIHHFPPSHLDPPLLNFIPGLPPLKLPLPDISVEFPYQESPSPTSQQRIHEHYPVPPASPSAQRASGYASPPLPISSQSSMLSSPDADSAVLPPSHGTQPLGDHLGVEGPMHTHAHAPEMDAFALATAVAASHSRSSFSIPPSVQSAGALASVGTSSIAPDVPRSPAYRRPSATTDASAGHRGRVVPNVREDSRGQRSVVYLHPGLPDNTRSRRVSAPQPSVWRSPRIQPVRTISSRVDVGEDGRKNRPLRQPVLGKVRKIGERLRGLFKSKVESVPTGRPRNPSNSPEYGLMTTTTAITNVEYESEHPIPLPSPRARIMRNHRRSLPLPMLLSSAERLVHSTMFSRSPGESGLASEPPLTMTVHESAEPSDEQRGLPTRDLEDPGRSPRTPKARRERTPTAPQAVETEQKPIKSRRFSLSSALTKSKMESLRSTVIPRPPLPIPSSQSKLSVATDPARHAFAPRSDTSGIRGRNITSGDPAHGHLWGGELPVLQDEHDCPIICVVSDDSPVRTRTHTAPSPSALLQQQSGDTPTAGHKRSRRFSLSSIMAKRSSRAAPLPGGQPPLPDSHPQTSRRRPRGDTVTTITHGSVQFDMVYPRTRLNIGPWPAVPETLPSHRSSLVSQSSGAESTYYDAPEIASEDDRHRFPRSSSPQADSDLDSMSFARTLNCSSGTFSIGSSTEREYFLEASTSEPSTLGSYTHRPIPSQRYAGHTAVSQLVAGSSSTPIRKTLRFSPSLSLSFDMSCSDYEDDDDLGRLEQQEELSFMRTLGFEFDEIARRVREESL